MRLADQHQRAETQGEHGQHRLASVVRHAEQERAGRVADVLYATMTAESCTLFVTERGWSLDQWRDWAHDTIARELTPDSPSETSG